MFAGRAASLLPSVEKEPFHSPVRSDIFLAEDLRVGRLFHVVVDNLFDPTNWQTVVGEQFQGSPGP